MAGGGITAGGSGRRRSLEAETNLVPFIDLLSVCICFLLMTAVWIQVGAVPVKQSHGTDAPAQSKQQYEMELKFVQASSLELSVKRGGRVAQKIAVKAAEPTEAMRALDQKIGAWLGTLGGGSGKDWVSSAMVTPAEGVPYGDLVAALDVFRKHQIVNLGVHPVKN